MNIINRIKIIFFTFLFLLTGCVSKRLVQKDTEILYPKREFRGVWIQTAYQPEYKQMTISELKKSFITKLDKLQECGINAIIFQVRPEADAFYPSKLEPWSRFYTGLQGVAPENNFDLMAFLIEACHQRNIEFHAWLNPYRAGTIGSTKLASNHIYYKHPEWFVQYHNKLLFDPGLPACRNFICCVVRDIVSRYDVDAIHMDDYFYPYPVAGKPFPDENSFKKYGKNYTVSQKGDWRRENVNILIKKIRQTILLAKPWVRFGISPFGIYRNKKNTPDGSGSNTNGTQNYDDLYADVIHWVNKGWVDYLIPQIYWEIGHPAADYKELSYWWNKYASNRPLYIGQDVARTMKVGQLEKKMQIQHILSNVQGECFWPANEILWNNSGIFDTLKKDFHRYPALIPAYTHQHNRKPKDVRHLKAEWTAHGYELIWTAEQNKNNPELASYFVIYRFSKGETIDIGNTTKIVCTTRKTSYLLPYEDGSTKYYYVVTAVDRFHNESKHGKKKKVKL